MMNKHEFVNMFGNKNHEKLVRFAKVDPNYTEGRPSLIFDGETVPTVKLYPYLSTYVPTANDRVMVVKGVIVGKIM